MDQLNTQQLEVVEYGTKATKAINAGPTLVLDGAGTGKTMMRIAARLL